jgi:hypothetical protein
MAVSRSRSASPRVSFSPGFFSLANLRIMELFSIFAIVFLAHSLAHFNLKTDLLLSLFLASAFLQYYSNILWARIGKRLSWSPTKVKTARTWYSCYIDLISVELLIYFTGTVQSPFLFLLAAPLFFAINLISLRDGILYFFLPAMFATAGLGYLELKQLIPHHNCYAFMDETYLNPHYYIGAILVLGALLSLIFYVSNLFRDRLRSALFKLCAKPLDADDRVVELTRLFDISIGINSVISLDTMLKIVAKEATLLLSQPWASIVLFNNKHEISESVFVGINKEDQARLGNKIRHEGLSEWIYHNQTHVVVEDVLKDRRTRNSDFLINSKIRSLVGYPLINGNQVIGVIYTGDFVAKKFKKKHIKLLAILSNQLTVAIEKSRLYESLERKIRHYEKTIKNLEKTNYLKSDFVSHVSHELKTPLTSMKAYVETLYECIDDPNFHQKKQFLEIVMKETDRLIKIVRDILDVSQIEFGQRPLNRKKFGIEELIREVVSMMQPSLSEKKTKIVMMIPDDVPNVDADPDLLKQVFINLISNAVKYSPEGSTITISVEEEAVELAISIEDEGIGIPEEELERIFEKYFRVRNGEATKYEGAGLGLAIVKNIVEQHGGTITVQSKPGKGSKFTFTIPKEHCVNDLLGYLSEIISAKEELHEMLELIVKMIADLLSAKIVSLMLLDENRKELFIKVSYGLDDWIVEQARVKLGEGIAGKVAESGAPLLIDNIEQNEVYTCINNPQYETMSLLSVPLYVNNIVVGVINVNNKTSGKPFNNDDMNLLISFSERISRALERVRKASDTNELFEDTIEAFKKMLENQQKVKSIEALVNLTVKLCRKMGLSDKEVKVIQYVASVHDIGMTKISDEILNKALNLTTEERREIERHPEHGTEIMRPLEFVELASNIILYHHERVDGKGYPMGLKGNEIPIGSRILAVLDAYQSMTADKPYRTRISPEEAIKELIDCADKQFDREVVEAFIEVLRSEGQLSSSQTRRFKKRLKVGVGSG